ncbi:hypothetical protein NW127_03220 [Staphylococcus pettenkoferi]|nr:hypothetical protein [Staphylococcus pettenkoferi]MCY1575687.1 hypothetical protein [Staphylococcus pettenkoferi]
MSDIRPGEIQKGSKEYTNIIIALFIAGFTTFSILYCVQPLIPAFSRHFHVNET